MSLSARARAAGVGVPRNTVAAAHKTPSAFGVVPVARVEAGRFAIEVDARPEHVRVGRDEVHPQLIAGRVDIADRQRELFVDLAEHAARAVGERSIDPADRRDRSVADLEADDGHVAAQDADAAGLVLERAVHSRRDRRRVVRVLRQRRRARPSTGR